MNQKKRLIRRILVALDTSPHSRAALAAAANLAARLEAQLIGVYVEDMNLLRLAQLPFAQEIHYASATPQKLDKDVMEKQLRSQADRAQNDLRQTAEQHALEWSFQVLRGLVAAELLTAAEEADLLVLGRTSRQTVPGYWLGSTARTAIAQHQRPVLLMSSHYNLNQPPLLIYDGSAAAQRALPLAVTLARVYGRLSVLLIATDEAQAQLWQQTIHRQAADDRLQIECHMVLGIEQVAAVLSQLKVGLIVTGQAGSPLSQLVNESLFEAGNLPMLIVE